MTRTVVINNPAGSTSSFFFEFSDQSKELWYVSESGFTGSTLCPPLAPGHAWIEEMRPDSRQVLDSGGMRRFDIERGSEVERTLDPGTAAATAEPAISPGATVRCANELCFQLIPDCLPPRDLKAAQDPEATAVIEGELHCN
jgi:hypothetical protein